MCTFTWWPNTEGYGFFFNRDELDTRAAETPPVLGATRGIAHLAPHDGDGGGTWLGVNARGVSVVLLNDYTVAWRPPAPALSRGGLVKAALGGRSPAEVGSIVADFDVGRAGAFRLVALGRAGDAHVFHWDGRRLDHASGDDVDQFFSSSSFSPTEVIAARRAAYDQLPTKSDEDVLRAFHWSHDPADGARSVLMRRPDAATRSVCEVSVGEREATLAYTPVVWEGETLASGRTGVFTLPLS